MSRQRGRESAEEMQRSSRNPIWFIVIVVLAIGGVIAYFVGGALVRTEAAKHVTAAESQAQNARSQTVAVQSVNSLLRASNAIYRASAALDNRNFGTANGLVVQAIADLKAVDSTVSGVDAQKLVVLEKQAAAVKVSVATNLEVQRTQLHRLASAIEAITPKATTGANGQH